MYKVLKYTALGVAVGVVFGTGPLGIGICLTSIVLMNKLT